MFASEKGSVEMVELLLKCNAPIDEQSNVRLLAALMSALISIANDERLAL